MKKYNRKHWVIGYECNDEKSCINSIYSISDLSGHTDQSPKGLKYNQKSESFFVRLDGLGQVVTHTPHTKLLRCYFLKEWWIILVIFLNGKSSFLILICKYRAKVLLIAFDSLNLWSDRGWDACSQVLFVHNL